jgi:hypothetical protein
MSGLQQLQRVPQACNGVIWHAMRKRRPGPQTQQQRPWQVPGSSPGLWGAPACRPSGGVHAQNSPGPATCESGEQDSGAARLRGSWHGGRCRHAAVGHLLLSPTRAPRLALSSEK